MICSKSQPVHLFHTVMRHMNIRETHPEVIGQSCRVATGPRREIAIDAWLYREPPIFGH